MQNSRVSCKVSVVKVDSNSMILHFLLAAFLAFANATSSCQNLTEKMLQLSKNCTSQDMFPLNSYCYTVSYKTDYGEASVTGFHNEPVCLSPLKLNQNLLLLTYEGFYKNALQQKQECVARKDFVVFYRQYVLPSGETRFYQSTALCGYYFNLPDYAKVGSFEFIDYSSATSYVVDEPFVFNTSTFAPEYYQQCQEECKNLEVLGWYNFTSSADGILYIPPLPGKTLDQVATKSCRCASPRKISSENNDSVGMFQLMASAWVTFAALLAVLFAW